MNILTQRYLRHSLYHNNQQRSQRTIFLAFILVVIVVAFCNAAPVFAQRGGLYSFLRDDASARAAAMGGTFVSMPNDAAAMFYNPAAIGTLDSSELSMTFLKHALDINSGFAVYGNDLRAFGINDNGAVAIGVNYVNYGQFERADKNGVVQGTFGGFDIAMSLAYANNLDSNWYYGVALKYIANGLDNAGSGAIAFDAGMMYSIPKARTNIGVSVLHIGKQVSSIGGIEEQLPTDVRIGVNHQLRGLPLLVSFSLNRLADKPATDYLNHIVQNLSFGGELSLGKSLQLRFGYDNRRRRGLAPDAAPRLTGFSAGAGIVFKDLRIDYALSADGTVGNIQRFSVNVRL